MRLIDADALLSNYKGNILTAQTDYAQGARDIIDDIRNAPTVDAVPVVRCKDCKWLYVYIEEGDVRKQCVYRNYVFCPLDELNGFCEKGERKDG